MALATAPPPTSEPGLSARTASVSAALGSLLADLCPDTLVGADAAALYADFARIEHLVVAAKVLLAPRIATSGLWEAEGHRSAASLLATLEGGSPGQAQRLLATGQHLSALPSVEAALRAGRLSGAKAAHITDAAAIDPGSEGTLLAGAEHEPLRVTKERCQHVKATSAHHDPLAAARRVHANRFFTTWTEDGAFCFRGSDTPERGAALMARLVPTANRLRSARRAAATEGTPVSGGPAAGAAPSGPAAGVTHESDQALFADALFFLATGRTTAAPTDAPGTDAPTDSTDTSTDTQTADRATPAGVPDLATAEDLIDRPAPVMVIVRVDRDALIRGHAAPGELCELDGHGPVSVPLATALAVDSFLSVIFTEAGDIRAVSHQGRTVDRRTRTALAYRDKTCVVPGCAMAYGLEIDHVTGWALGGRTELANLALLCTHHHRLKTFDGWVLARNGPTDEDPQWSFTPLPPFGQEPDLGLDRPPAAVPRK
jgi:Domain of unknown function (DUF222)/HNH endonuclease